MLATLEAKVLAALLAGAVALAVVASGYAAYSHIKAQAVQITKLQADNDQEKANTAAALQAEAALSNALNAKSAAQQVAAQNQTATTTRLASAVAAAPAVASEVVPESYWQAIYGSPNAK